MNVEGLLLNVEKPARYIGNEINMVVKDPDKVDIRFAFCFPDSYEVGMSHLGMQILYFFLNQRADTYCERVFAPWVDMEQELRKHQLELFSLETWTPISTFDFLGFTLQYEMSYTNILTMLNLSNIPFLSKDRSETDPIVCAGGPCAYNPEPLADIVDFFYIGEGEAVLHEILDLYQANKQNAGTKSDFLESLLAIECVYVPKYYDVNYKETGEIQSFTPNHPKASKKIKKVVVTDLDSVFYPEQQLVPLIETVHDRVVLEVFRGCIRGCRFCQAGYVFRPVREKTPDTLIEQSKCLISSSGHEEISLTSLSTGDYRKFQELSTGLIEEYDGKNISLSLPSLRIDAFNLELMSKVSGVRKSSLTFAPEAGTQRLRDAINKGITEEEILTGSQLAFEGGWNRVKLYFMVGLPTETLEDVQGIGLLSDKIVEKYYQLPKEQRGRPVTISSSLSCFVPKPFTPFQWAPQSNVEEFLQKISVAKRSSYKKQVKMNYHEPIVSVLEGVIARGDRRIAKLIIKAWELGAKFDGWTEQFNRKAWEQAFEETGIDQTFYTTRQRELTEILPWDHIEIGVTKDYFIQEWEKSQKEEITANCRKKCSNCGANRFGGGVCFESIQA